MIDLQVVRHERASVKADMWSYGILVWELISDQDITNLQPLAIAQAMQVGLFVLLRKRWCLMVKLNFSTRVFIQLLTQDYQSGPCLHSFMAQFLS